MDSDQTLIDSYVSGEEALRAADYKQKADALRRYEDAAKKAHKIRQSNALLRNYSVPSWEELALVGQRHLIVDAEIVSNNPSTTESELRKLYLERLIAWGDTESSDLNDWDENSEGCEQMVLKELKAILNR